MCKIVLPPKRNEKTDPISLKEIFYFFAIVNTRLNFLSTIFEKPKLALFSLCTRRLPFSRAAPGRELQPAPADASIRIDSHSRPCLMRSDFSHLRLGALTERGALCHPSTTSTSTGERTLEKPPEQNEHDNANFATPSEQKFFLNRTN